MPSKARWKAPSKKVGSAYFFQKVERISNIRIYVESNAFTSKVLINALESNFESTEQKNWKRIFFQKYQKSSIMFHILWNVMHLHPRSF